MGVPGTVSHLSSPDDCRAGNGRTRGVLTVQDVWPLLSRFNDLTERGMVTELYGLLTGRPMPREAVARMFEVTEEVVDAVDDALHILVEARSSQREIAHRVPCAGASGELVDRYRVAKKQVLGALPRQSARVLAARYGVFADQPLPAEAIERAFGVPRVEVEAMSEEFERRLGEMGVIMPGGISRSQPRQPLREEYNAASS